MTEGPASERIYMLLPGGAVRIHPDPAPKPFSSLYKGLSPGLYEAARTYPGGKVFGFQPHHERLVAGCGSTGLTLPLQESELRAGLQTIIDEFPEETSKLRWDLLSAPKPDWHGESRTLATITPLPPVPDWVYADGAALQSCHELRRKDAHVKGSQFAVDRQRIPYGHRENYEPLLLSEGDHILEGAQSNFGAFIGDTLHAPSEAVLPGITIQAVIQLAAEMGFLVSRDPLPLERVSEMSGAFLCSSVRGVVPVSRIDGSPIGDGGVGQKVERLRQAYAKHAESAALRLA